MNSLFLGLASGVSCRAKMLATRRYATGVTHGDVLKPSSFGQPLFQSHPHLVQSTELTPGFSAQEYETRRRKLMDSLPESSIVVSVAGSIKYMSGQIFYKFRQDSNFWYLTGFDEPDSAVILEKTSTSRGYRMTLFSAGKDSAKEKWDGARTSLHEAGTLFQADDARCIDQFSSHLRSALSTYSNVFVDVPPAPRGALKSSKFTTKSILKYLSPAVTPRTEYDSVVEAISHSRRKPLAPKIAHLRAIKSEAELSVMRQAADISGRAHAKTMRFTRPGLSEAALAAHFEYLTSLAGSQRPAYVPVVASGANALIIHYTSNNHLIQEGEVLLIDAGCEYNGYASDITRSFPASGTFTAPQRDLYAAVLSVQKALIGLCTESSGFSMHQIHSSACTLLREELKQIGLDVRANDLEQVLFPHYVSHPIGLDLHESSHFERHGRLKAGMVITIEPGIYVPPSASFPAHFHNIGIRIEDEVVVGKDQPVVLSVAAPKEIADVEGACQGLLGLEPY
ncbi:peptidase M24 [Mycena albidolilacea]|uniref:Peptidase M24 n=1 Tax=Mycena albidolilacea TaxID=1033008 RepID=A0AAD7ATQ0_9AGAR|nr:peptidase M24 [Mycena albidolilacea]